MTFPDIRTTVDGTDVYADWEDGQYTVWGPGDTYLGTLAPAESPLGTDWVPTAPGGTESPGWGEVGNAMAVLWVCREDESRAEGVWRSNVYGMCQEIFANLAWIEAI